MEISIIAAVTLNNVIGLNGKMPWLIKNDLKRFKELTMGNCVIMGRKTFFSLSKALDGRKNIVLTNNKNLVLPNCSIANSVDEAINLCNSFNKVFIIGGNSVFSAFLNLTNKIYLTKIYANIKGDTFMPEINYNDWQLIEQEDFNDDKYSDYPYSFLTFIKKTNLYI